MAKTTLFTTVALGVMVITVGERLDTSLNTAKAAGDL